MNKYVIITDSSSDLDKALREKYDLHYIPNRFNYEGKEYNDDTDWETFPIDTFYDYLRSGNRITTSQISAVACVETFEKYLDQGFDVLAITTPAVLSATANVFVNTCEKLKEKYPDRKMIAIDAKVSSGGLALLCVRAAELRNEGKTIDEVAAWVEENKKFIHQEGSVESLTYLKRAGRISAASAFFGGLLNIKPMIISDVHGYNVAVEKVKGRKTSLLRTVEKLAQNIRPDICPYIFIHHTVCEEDALFLKEEILKRVNVKEENIHIGNVNAVMGASVGPGMFGVYFYGCEVTYDSKVN